MAKSQVSAPKVTVPTVGSVSLGAPYAPKANTAQNNTASWATVREALETGPQTVASLTKLLAEKHNHSPFVGYAVRRGWLVVAK